MRAFWRGFAYWIVLAAGWILLTFTANYQEAVAGSAVGAIVLAFASAVHRHSKARFAVPEGWAGPVAGLAPKILSDSWLLALALYRSTVCGERVDGRLVDMPFEPGGADPESAARRAIVLAGVSLTPNTLAIDIDRDRRILLMHELMYKPPERRDPQWPL